MANFSAAQSKVEEISISKFQGLLSSPADGAIYKTLVSCAGSANVRLEIGECDRLEGDTSNVVKHLSRADAHKWTDHYVTLVNRPCAVVVSNGAVLLNDAEVFMPSVYPSAGDQSVERQLGVRYQTVGDAYGAAEDLRGRGVFSCFFSRWSTVYFHAVSECLVQQNTLESIFPQSCVLNVLVPEQINAIQRKILAVSDVQCVFSSANIVLVDRFLFSSVSKQHAVLNLDFRASIERLKVKARQFAQQPSRCDKLYISRLKETMRPLVNEEEVVRLVKDRGFSIVEPQNLNLYEQINLFSNAKTILAPHGAGLVNAVFAQPDALLCEVRASHRKGGNPDMNETYRKISAIMGMRYGFFITSNSADEDPWYLSPKDLNRLLDRLG